MLALIAGFLLLQPLFHHAGDPVPVADGPQPVVLLFSTRSCGYCAQARRFFDRNGIRFTEHDVEMDQRAASNFDLLGGRGVPLVVVGDRILHGYDERALARMLGPWMR